MYRVFLVEDDQVIAQAVKARLEAWDMQVQCAGDFQECAGTIRPVRIPIWCSWTSNCPISAVTIGAPRFGPAPGAGGIFVLRGRTT